MSRGIIAPVLLFAAGLLAACHGSEEPKVATELQISPGTSALSEGASQQFVAKVLDQNGEVMSGAAFTWESSNSDLISVDANGLVKARDSFFGISDPLPAVTITAKAGSLTRSVSITVMRTGDFEVWPDTNLLYPGMTRDLRPWLIKAYFGYPTVPIDSPTGPVSWTSSDAGIATVSPTGSITAVAAGHARIVATYGTRHANVEVYVATTPASPLRFTTIATNATFLASNGPYGFVYASRACGLTADGSMYCWGAFADPTQPSDRCVTTHGGVGRYTQFRFRCNEIPVRVQTNLSFTGMVVGGNFTCGLASTKRVYCWGQNTGGELGIGSVDLTTHGIAAIAGADDFAELHGRDTACGIRTDAALRCWGGAYGPAPTTVTGGPTAWRTIAEAGACGLASDSTAYCFGAGGAHAVGGTAKWKSIATSSGQTPCAIALDDTVFCGSDLQSKPTIPEPIVRLGGQTFALSGGFSLTNCGLTAGGDLRCADTWSVITLPVKVSAAYGHCVIALDQKVYCRSSTSSLWQPIPGQQ